MTRLMTHGARLVVSVGCPSGIGPEVSVVAAARTRARVALVGDVGAVMRAADARGVPRSRIEVVDEPRFARGSRVALWQPTKDLAARDRELGRPSRAGGAAQLAWIDAACDWVERGDGDALVTGPVSKDAVVRSGARGSARVTGPTEHRPRRLRARETVMAFAGEHLVTSLVTTHLPLAKVPRAVTAEGVSRATFWLAMLLRKLGSRTPRIAVAALNPHAGEAGLLGGEEASRVAPGIARARARLSRARVAARLEGPVPAETAFRLAAAGRFDGVVAMYHDQATIPMKLLDFGDAVNVSLGLPIVRTSVDHGTGYDRASRFDADPRGMLAAMRLAARLAS